MQQLVWSATEKSYSEPPLHPPGEHPPRRELDWRQLALLGDRVAVIGDVRGIKLEVQALRLVVPEVEAERHIGSEMLWQAHSLGGRPAAVAEVCSGPEIAP